VMWNIVKCCVINLAHGADFTMVWRISNPTVGICIRFFTFFSHRSAQMGTDERKNLGDNYF
jgi:hypothetical protein